MNSECTNVVIAFWSWELRLDQGALGPGPRAAAMRKCTRRRLRQQHEKKVQVDHANVRSSEKGTEREREKTVSIHRVHSPPVFSTFSFFFFRRPRVEERERERNAAFLCLCKGKERERESAFRSLRQTEPLLSLSLSFCREHWTLLAAVEEGTIERPARRFFMRPGLFCSERESVTPDPILFFLRKSEDSVIRSLPRSSEVGRNDCGGLESQEAGEVNWFQDDQVKLYAVF